MLHVVMVGTGYVGLVSGACLAEIGHRVSCVDVDLNKINKLRDGIAPIYEPGIEQLLRRNQENDRLSFSSDLEQALKGAAVAFIAVGTPPGENGQADLKYVEAVAEHIGNCVTQDLLVIVKSTVPVGSCDRVEKIIHQALKSAKREHLRVTVASNPEFLKEGSAIADFMNPDRIVVGTKNQQGLALLRELYQPFLLEDPSRFVAVERRASEMIKYTANSMLATRISFMNELTQLCERLGVDIEQVRLGVGRDPRIGPKFLQAGPGYGGSCFPKDVAALLHMAEAQGLSLQLLTAVQDVNARQKLAAATKISSYFGELRGKTICVWGLSFKPGTDDVREAPAKTIIEHLLAREARVTAYDPKAMETFASEFGPHPHLKMATSAYEALQGADALVLVTEWGEFKWPNWQKVAQALRHKAVFDLRNQYDSDLLRELGFYYQSMGRETLAGNQI